MEAAFFLVRGGNDGTGGGCMECFSFPFEAMGSRCGIHVFSEDRSRATETAERVILEVKRIEARFSRYSDESETTRINRGAAEGLPVTVDVEVARLLNQAFRFHRISNGLFDITSGILQRVWDFSSAIVPQADQVRALLPLVGMRHLAWHDRTLQFMKPGMQIDFGGVAKEYAADRAAELCRKAGQSHTLVDLGGDLVVVGPLPDGSPWKIRIRHPRNNQDAFSIFEVSKGGVATSGDYERFMEVSDTRYCHILNPITGFPVQSISSVTVVASSCSLAGGLSTSAMLMEDCAAKWLTATNRRHAWILTNGESGGTLLEKV